MGSSSSLSINGNTPALTIPAMIKIIPVRKQPAKAPQIACALGVAFFLICCTVNVNTALNWELPWLASIFIASMKSG